jgi:hypothetical protein
MEQLPDDALRAVAEVVDIVVRHDADRLAGISAYDGDLYEWTRDYGHHGTVDLVLPPGAPRDWEIDWGEQHNGGLWVVVTMWTHQEGRSDLSLEFRLHREDSGGWRAEISNLHVL